MKDKLVWSQELDKEWLELMIEAKNLGIELATIMEFLKENNVKGVIA